MPSQLGWMDHDESQRRRILAAIELFKDEGTVDELGVGSVRDTIAGALFPGVSVLHTRARYLFFVPWCVMRTAHSARPGPDAMRELRRQEILVLHALLTGGDEEGLIGRVARDKVKRLPSAAYWSVLRQWEIRRTDASIVSYLRDAALAREASTRLASPDEPDGGLEAADGFDPSLPQPPSTLVSTTSFALTPDEASYLADRWRMAKSTRSSLLPWLLDHYTDARVDDVWLHPDLESAPVEMKELVELGRQFSGLVHGAALLYNLLLAEKFDDPDARELDDTYRDRLIAWQHAMKDQNLASLWDADHFWVTLRRRHPGLSRATENFVNRWISYVREPGQLHENAGARRLVAERERSIKGGRARLVNRSALDQWQGASGLVRLDYNWRVTRRLVRDVVDGFGSSDEAVA